MVKKDKAIIEALLATAEELGPLQPPQTGVLLVSSRKYRMAAEILIQERNGVWHCRDLTEPGSLWRAEDYYVAWDVIWKKYAPLKLISITDIPIESLDEFIDIISWVPASDI